MSKSPMMVDTSLGEMHGTICGDENGAWLTVNGYRDMRITAEQLRLMADKLDRMQQAAKTFYNVIPGTDTRVYAITYGIGVGEECENIIAANSTDAVMQFCNRSNMNRNVIRSVFDKEAGEYVEF